MDKQQYTHRVLMSFTSNYKKQELNNQLDQNNEPGIQVWSH
jgi:hypothetical protein